MATLEELRKKSPTFAGMTDNEIVDYYAKNTGLHPELVANEFGVQLPNDPGFFTSAKSGLGSMAQGVGQLAGDFIPGIENNNSLERYGRNVTQNNPVNLTSGNGNALENIGHNLVENPWLTTKEIAGQAVGFMGPGVGLKAVTTGARAIRGINAVSRAGRIGEDVAQSAMFGLPSVAQMRDAQEAKGENSAADLMKAYGSALAVGKIETFGGAEKALTSGALNKTSGSLLKSIGKSGLEEAGEEIVQTPIEAYGSGDNPFTKDVAINAAAGGVAGFIGGGVFGGASHPLAKARDARIAADLEAKKQVSMLEGAQAGLDAPNPERTMAEGQARAAQLQEANRAAARAKAVADANLANTIDGSVGIGNKPKGKKDSVAAFNEQLPHPVRLPDENGKPFSTTDAYHLYLYQNGIPIPAESVKSPNNKAPKASATVKDEQVTPVKQFFKEVGMNGNGARRQAYAAQYLELVDKGIVSRDAADTQFLALLEKGNFGKIDKLFNAAVVAKHMENVSEQQKLAEGWTKVINPQDGTHTWAPPTQNTSAAPIQESATSADIQQEPEVTPPIARDASATDVQKLKAEAAPKLLNGLGQKQIDAMYALLGKRNEDDTGWEILDPETGEEMVPQSTRAAVSGEEDVASNKTFTNRKDAALKVIAKNAKAMGITEEAAHIILGIQGEPVVDTGPTVKSIEVAKANTQEYNDNDTTHEDYVPESNVGTEGAFEEKTNENGDAEVLDEGDSYEVDHSLQPKDFENALDVFEELNNDYATQGLEGIEWEEITPEDRQDLAKVIRSELLHAEGKSSVDRIEKVFRKIYDKRKTVDTEQTVSRSEGEDNFGVQSDTGEDAPIESPTTPKQPASSSGTEASEVDYTEAERKTKNSVDTVWPDQPINPKVQALVSALNKANIETTLSGDLYGNHVVYVDIAYPLSVISKAKLPSGWKADMTKVDITKAIHDTGELTPEEMDIALSEESRNLIRGTAYAGITRLSKKQSTIISEAEAKKVTSAIKEVLGKTAVEQPASSSGTEASEVDDTEALLKALKDLSKDKNKGAIAKDYITRAMRGEPVEDEARAWVDAVSHDDGLVASHGNGRTITREFIENHDELISHLKRVNKGVFADGQGNEFAKEYPDVTKGPYVYEIKAKDTNGNHIVIPAIQVQPNQLENVWTYLSDAHNNGHLKGLESLKGVYIVQTDALGLGAVQWNKDSNGYFLYLHANLVAGYGEGSLEHTIHHEVAHLEDDVSSKLPEFSEGRIFSDKGLLHIELVKAFISNRWVKEHFAYPMNIRQFKLSGKRLRAEIFAQIMAYYNLESTREDLKQHLPMAYKYAEGLMYDLEKNSTGRDFISAFSDRARYKNLAGKQGEAFATKRDSQHRSNNSTVSESSEKSNGLEGGTSGTKQNTYDKIVDALPEKAQEPIKFVSDALGSRLSTALRGSMFTSHLIEMVKDALPSAQRWYNAINAREVSRTAFEAKVDTIANEVDKLDTTARNKVWSYILDSTATAGWGYQPEWKEVAISDSMKKRFDALNEHEQAIVKSVFKHGHETIVKTQKLLDQQLDYTYADKLAAAKTPEEKAKIEKEMAKYRKMFSRKLTESEGPYAPMRRVGSHVVVAKSQAYLDAVARGDHSAAEQMKSDGVHYHVEFHNSMAQAKRAQRILATSFKDVKASEKLMANFEEGLPFSAFEKLRGMASDQDNKAAKKLVGMINELYLQSLADTSARKSEMRRANVAGLRSASGSVDAMYKAFLSKGKADAHYLSVLEHHKAISAAYGELNKEVNGLEGDRGDKSAIFNELTKRYENSFDYNPTPFIGQLMGINSVWMLLTKPAYYLYNATQPLMMSQPYMAQKYGYNKSMSAMLKAYGELKQMPSLVKSGVFSQMDLNGVPADVRQALEELRNMGRLDITLTQELGSRIHSGESKVSQVSSNLSNKLHALAQKVEMTNRIVTAAAAYRMAVKDVGHAKAVEYAKEVIDNTHGDYSNFNAPRYMNQNGFAKMVTQFRKFQLIQLSLFVREFRTMMKGETAAEKWALSKALRYTLAHHAILAGGMGLPIAGLVSMAFSAMGDDDDKRDFELEARKAIGDEFLASLLLHGVPSIANINMSGNVGAGQMLSILPYQDFDFNGRDKAASTLVGLSGPLLGGTFMQFADAKQAAHNGDYYKALIGIAPSGIKSALKAGLEGIDGVTNTKGDVTVSAEDITAWDTALKAVGIRTESDSIRQMVNSRKHDFEEFFNDRTHILKNQYAKAARNGDVEELNDIRQHWLAMQGFKREYGFKPQPLSNLIRSVQEQRKRERDTKGGVQFRAQDKGFVTNYADTED